MYCRGPGTCRYSVTPDLCFSATSAAAMEEALRRHEPAPVHVLHSDEDPVVAYSGAREEIKVSHAQSLRKPIINLEGEEEKQRLRDRV